MKPLYYVILYRPRGSKTWTPLELDQRSAGNYFASQDKAIAYIQDLLAMKHRTYLLGPGKWVHTEFATGAVMFNEEVK